MSTTTRIAALGAAGLLSLLATRSASALDASWPEEFNIHDVEIVVEQSQFFCFGGGIWTVRLSGQGDGRYCARSPDYVRNAPLPTCHDLLVSPEELLAHLEVLASVHFFSIAPPECENLDLTLSDDGRVVLSDIIFSTSGGNALSVSLRIGALTRTIGNSRGWPRELADWADSVLAVAAAGAPDPSPLAGTGP